MPLRCGADKKPLQTRRPGLPSCGAAKRPCFQTKGAAAAVEPATARAHPQPQRASQRAWLQPGSRGATAAIARYGATYYLAYLQTNEFTVYLLAHRPCRPQAATRVRRTPRATPARPVRRRRAHLARRHRQCRRRQQYRLRRAGRRRRQQADASRAPAARHPRRCGARAAHVGHRPRLGCRRRGASGWVHCESTGL